MRRKTPQFLKTKFRIKFLVTAVSVILPFILSAQSTDDLFSLYENKKFAELRAELNRHPDKINSNPDFVFLNALFMEDGDEAVKIFESLSTSTSGKLNVLIRQKISEYYYAKGFYVRAAEWKTENHTPLAATESPVLDDVPFKIQVGAFSFNENAIKVQNYLQSFEIRSEIIQRTINERTLFCVWINGKESKEQTIKYAEELKARFRLNYQILEP